VRRPVSSWPARPWRAAMVRRGSRRGSCIVAVLGAASGALACLLARGPFRSCGRSGVRRVAAHPCAAPPSVQHCRASMPGDSLKAHPMPTRLNASGSVTVESCPVIGTAADQAEPAMFETTALLVAGASSQLIEPLATPGQCRKSRKAIATRRWATTVAPRPKRTSPAVEPRRGSADARRSRSVACAWMRKRRWGSSGRPALPRIAPSESAAHSRARLLPVAEGWRTSRHNLGG